MRISGYSFGVRPRIAHVSAIKTKLFSPLLYETYWQTPEVTNPEGIYSDFQHAISRTRFC